ncbi:MAG: serine/threonine-protein kinase [Terracidiphilus sp.]
MKTCPLCSTSYPGHHTNCEHDGALLIASRDFDPGTVIRGKYRIERILGRGGMGSVYLAEHLLLGRVRALKFISSELSQDPALLKRFRREALAASELHHPNVVQVLDLDQAEDGTPFIAMEYIEGEDLCHLIAHGPLPVERALELARGITLGLGAAHNKRILHRDGVRRPRAMARHARRASGWARRSLCPRRCPLPDAHGKDLLPGSEPRRLDVQPPEHRASAAQHSAP